MKKSTWRARRIRKKALKLVRNRTVRRLRSLSGPSRLSPPWLVLLLDRRRRRRISAPVDPATTVVTCRLGEHEPASLHERAEGAQHVCFTDRPEGLPSHWLARPIEFWDSTDRRTIDWIGANLDKLFPGQQNVTWFDPSSPESTSTGSRRWFGDHSLLDSRASSNAKTSPSEDGVPPTTVIVPVHNAPESVRRCLGSVLATLRAQDRLVIVDDGSDELTAELCRSFADSQSAVLLRHEHALGFSAAVNAGVLSDSNPYVVVLNSDTEVPKGWIPTLISHLTRHPEAAAVGPISGAARFQSVPYLADNDEGRNALPVGVDLEWLNLFVRLWSSGIAPVRVPLLNGFCLGIRRTVVDEIGGFDAQAFPRGYGEENDWCIRARSAGHDLLVATDVYVAHSKGQSFQEQEATILKRAGTRILIERYGEEVLNHMLTAMRYPAALVGLRADLQALWSTLER